MPTRKIGGNLKYWRFKSTIRKKNPKDKKEKKISRWLFHWLIWQSCIKLFITKDLDKSAPHHRYDWILNPNEKNIPTIFMWTNWIHNIFFVQTWNLRSATNFSLSELLSCLPICTSKARTLFNMLQMSCIS